MLAKKGCTVLNGLAVGCDAKALEGAVVAKGGCLISEYPSGTKPQRYMFVQRDRIQAMLSNKVLIVDANKDGGTMHTAEYAVKYERPLGCFMETGGKESPSGNQFLIDSHKASAIRDTEGLMKFVEQPEYAQMTLFGAG